MIITITMHVTRNRVQRNSDYESDKRKSLLIYMNCLRKSFVFQRTRGFLNVMHYINPRFTYLLTYSLPQHQWNTYSARVNYSCSHTVLCSHGQ